MRGREWGALFLVWLTACAGAPRRVVAETDPYEAELDAIRYEVRVLTAGAVETEPVELDAEDFRKAMQVEARAVHGFERHRETARWLMEGEFQADLLAEVESGRVVRMVPQEDDSPLSAASNAEMLARYQRLCAEQYDEGDCLGLNADGPVLDRDDRRILALAFALGGVLQDTRNSLQQRVSPQAVLAMLIGAVMLYFTLWLLPEPVTKGVAALISIGLIAWLGAQTLWELMDGWARLVREADRATTFEELEEAGGQFSKVMGENTARVVMLVVTAAVGGGVARFSQKLPKLPGYERAAAQAEAQGVRLAKVGGVEAVAAPSEGTFTLMVRSPDSGATAAAEARAGVITIIRHQSGNRQVLINGQRWHVPAHKSVKDIPARDPVGDQLQAAAKEVARQWHPGHMSRPERNAIETARAKGEHWKANLLESEARGRFVHREVAKQFENLRWNPRGVDAVDPMTGYRYELLTRTASNLERHGSRMAEELFRMVGF
jgi:hypothetical protein